MMPRLQSAACAVNIQSVLAVAYKDCEVDILSFVSKSVLQLLDALVDFTS